MSRIIDLPTEDECTLLLKVDGTKEITVDIFQIRQMMYDAGDEASANQQENDWRDFFIANFFQKYGVTLTPTSAYFLMERATEELEAVKKKFYPLPELQDSTEPPLPSNS